MERSRQRLNMTGPDKKLGGVELGMNDDGGTVRGRCRQGIRL